MSRAARGLLAFQTTANQPLPSISYSRNIVKDKALKEKCDRVRPYG
jgi:hypothetical protein